MRGLIAWIFGGVVLAFFTNDRLSETDLSAGARILGAVLAGLLVPLRLGHALRWLWCASVELYRYRFPAKVKLPEARVIK